MAAQSSNPAEEIANGYAGAGAAIELGSVVIEDQVTAEARVRIPLATLNRHGLVAGATGTGKTKTLQLIAEQLSAAGVSVMVADMKGDLSGLAQPGGSSDRVRQRATDTGFPWAGAGM